MIQPQSFQIDLRIYPGHLLVCINETDQEITRIMKKAKKTQQQIDDVIKYPKEIPGTVIMYEGGNMAMFFRGVDYNADFQEYVAHEIFHVISLKLRDIGMELNSGSEEAYAYFIGYLTRIFWRNIKL